MAASRGEHAACIPGTLLNARYKVVKEIGVGNFAKVFRCLDTKHNSSQEVAVKLVKKEYATDATYERDILRALGVNEDPRGKVVHMIDSFNWNRFPAFVFPLKGPALRSCKLGVARGHIERGAFVQFCYEMIRTMKYMHEDIKIIHTDLKPENILLDEPENKDPKGIGRGWTIADFGSASFYRPEKLDCDLIQTRPYRSPEVVLGNSWHAAADVWSMGCILYEIYMGTRLFDVHDDVEHLSQFQRRLGKLPDSLTKKSKYSVKFFDSHGNLIDRRLRRPAASHATEMKPLTEVLRSEPLFSDLLHRMLDFNMSSRMRASDALRHPFFEDIHQLTANGAMGTEVVKFKSSPAGLKKPASPPSSTQSANISPEQQSRAASPATKSGPKVLQPTSTSNTPRFKAPATLASVVTNTAVSGVTPRVTPRGVGKARLLKPSASGLSGWPW